MSFFALWSKWSKAKALSFNWRQHSQDHWSAYMNNWQLICTWYYNTMIYIFYRTLRSFGTIIILLLISEKKSIDKMIKGQSIAIQLTSADNWQLIYNNIVMILCFCSIDDPKLTLERPQCLLPFLCTYFDCVHSWSNINHWVFLLHRRKRSLFFPL